MRSYGFTPAKQGFTFIELVLVVVTLLILGVATVPRFGPAMAGWEAERAAADAAQVLRVGQAAAVAEAETVECRYDEDQRRFELRRVTGPNLSAVLQSSRTLPPKTRVDVRLPAQQSGLLFYPNGTSSGATVILTIADQYVYHLAIDPITSVITLHSGRPVAG